MSDASNPIEKPEPAPMTQDEFSRLTMKEIKARAIEQRVFFCGGNREKAAASLGMSFSGIRKFLDRQEQAISSEANAR